MNKFIILPGKINTNLDCIITINTTFNHLCKNSNYLRQRFLDNIQSFGDYNHLTNTDFIVYKMNVEWYFQINDQIACFIFNLNDYNWAMNVICSYLWFIN